MSATKSPLVAIPGSMAEVSSLITDMRGTQSDLTRVAIMAHQVGSNEAAAGSFVADANTVADLRSAGIIERIKADAMIDPYEWLCFLDKRNPDNEIEYHDGPVEARPEDCACYNCETGCDNLAMEIVRIMQELGELP